MQQSESEPPAATDEGGQGNVREPGLKALDELAADPARAEFFQEVLSKYLDHGVVGSTYDDLSFGVSALVPSEALAVLTWLSQPGSQSVEERLESLQAREETDAFLRRTVALFGPRLSEALFSADRAAPQKDDWLSFSSRVTQDLESGEFILSTRIEKFNGEALFIEGDAISMTRFARQALRALGKVDDPSAFPAAETESLVDAWERFSEISESQDTEHPPKNTKD